MENEETRRTTRGERRADPRSISRKHVARSVRREERSRWKAVASWCIGGVLALGLCYGGLAIGAGTANVEGIRRWVSPPVLTVSRRDLDAAKAAEFKEAAHAAGQPIRLGREQPPVPKASAEKIGRAVEAKTSQVVTVRLIDTLEEDGDVVRVAVNGVDLGDVVLSHKGQTISIPLESGVPSHLQIRAVRDGGGGVTFGAVSSVGTNVTRVMAEGDTETWTLRFQ